MLLSTGTVWRHKDRQTATNASSYSPQAFPRKGKSSIYYGTLRVLTEACSNLHDIIGCSQEISTKASCLRNLHNLIEGPKNTTKSQSHLGSKDPKWTISWNKILKRYAHKLSLPLSPRRTQTYAPNAMTSSSFSNANKAIKPIGGIREEEQRGGTPNVSKN